MSVRFRPVLAGALVLMTCGGPARAAGASWRELLDQAEKLSAAGKPEEAATAARSALADAEKVLGPENAEIGHILSRLSAFYQAAGFSTRLPEMEKRLSAVKSKDPEVLVSLGDVLRDEEKSSEAEGALKKALAVAPDDPAAEIALSRLYDDMGRFKEEVPLLKKMIEEDPRDYPLYSRLAQVDARLGLLAQAKATFGLAKKKAGSTAGIYIDEGYFYMHSRKYVDAQKDFEHAIAVDTASPFGYHHMGTYLFQNRQYPGAEKYFRLALERLKADPNTKADDLLHTLLDLGKVLQARERYPEAEALYLAGLEKARPGGRYQLWLLQSLATLYASEGKNSQAEAIYRRAVDVCQIRFRCDFEDAGAALIDLGQFYLSQGRRADAEAMAERAEKFCSSVPVGRGRFHLLGRLSGFYTKLGEVSKYEAICNRVLPMRRAMPFNPDLIWVERGLADMDAALGRFPEAEEHLRLEIGILGHNGYWKEEADVLDVLAAVYNRDGQRAAEDAAREQAIALRSKP